MQELVRGVDSGGAPAACPICGRRHSTRARVLFGYVLDATLPLFYLTGGYIVFCGRRHSARALYVRSSRLSRAFLPARLPIYVWTLGELSAKAGDSDRGADATYWIAFGARDALRTPCSRRGSARSRPVRDPTSSLADERGGDAGSP